MTRELSSYILSLGQKISNINFAKDLSLEYAKNLLLERDKDLLLEYAKN